MIVEGFANVISETIVSSKIPTSGVDVPRELRLNKCTSVLAELKNIQPRIELLVGLSSPVGVQARLLNPILLKLCNIS